MTTTQEASSSSRAGSQLAVETSIADEVLRRPLTVLLAMSVSNHRIFDIHNNVS